MVLEERNITVSVVVPSLRGDVKRLIRKLNNQTRKPDEIEVVVGESPNGRARNLGVERTKGEIIVFIDDDAVPGSPELIEELVRKLVDEESVGITGAARVLPPDASWFQKRVAKEIPRTVNPIPETELETNPPLEGHGHSLITTTCCAIRRSVYEQIGRFSDDMISGVDTEFFYRTRCEGYKFIMVPEVYVEHPAPANLIKLWKKYYWYGLGYGQETQRHPERKMGFILDDWIKRVLFIIAASFWILPNIIFLYSFGYPKNSFGFRPLKAISTYAVAWGYMNGWRAYNNRKVIDDDIK